MNGMRFSKNLKRKAIKMSGGITLYNFHLDTVLQEASACLIAVGNQSAHASTFSTLN
jgi:hypothetical protein